MTHLDSTFFKKFWSILERLDRMTSGIYPKQACQKDIFIQRVSKLFLKEGYSRFAIAGKFHVGINPKVLKLSYEHQDRIMLNYFSAITGEYETINFAHNEGIRITYEEISLEKFTEILNLCNGTIEERFINEYTSGHKFFAKYIKQINSHPLTALIYERLSGNITDDKLQGVADMIWNSGYWEGDGFYISKGDAIRNKMPQDYAWHYLDQVKNTLIEFKYIKVKKTGFAA
jgi:hypothetical protein